MSIETEINRIRTNVSGTLSAISEMGGGVPDGATSDDMASGVRSIPVGAKIDDTTPSTSTTYSSSKIESEINKLNEANAAQDTEIAKKANDADLAKIAKSGSYNDLTNKPTIPTVPTTLPNPNKLKLTGAVTAEYDGSSAVSVEIPAGGTGSYTLPIASPTTLGGVMPAAKTGEMTQAVGVDADGKLWGMPGGGSEWELIFSVTTKEEVNRIGGLLERTGYFSELLIFVLIQPTETNTANGGTWFFINDDYKEISNGKKTYQIGSNPKTNISRAYLHAYLGDTMSWYSSQQSTHIDNTMSQENVGHSTKFTKNTELTAVGVNTQNGSTVFGIGTIVEIYGKRVN